jgi:hypothetical protein
MNTGATKHSNAGSGEREEEKLTPFGVELALRRKLWAKPLDDAFPGIFGGVENGEAKGEVARLAKEVGLPAFLIGAAALEDAFRRDDASDKNLFAAGEAVKGKYLSLWEVATKTFGVSDDLSAELLCQLLFLGLSACAGGVEGGGDGGDGGDVHAGEFTRGAGKVEEEKFLLAYEVFFEGRRVLVQAASVRVVFCEHGQHQFLNASGDVVASFPSEFSAFNLLGRWT